MKISYKHTKNNKRIPKENKLVYNFSQYSPQFYNTEKKCYFFINYLLMLQEK